MSGYNSIFDVYSEAKSDDETDDSDYDSVEDIPTPTSASEFLSLSRGGLSRLHFVEHGQALSQ